MRFEIEADIPDGYEPTGEYRTPRAGEWHLHHTGSAIRTTFGDGIFPLPILREKPLAYEDFKYRDGVRVTPGGTIAHKGTVDYPAQARLEAAALIAAADHVDRVNAQKGGVS